MTTNSIQGSNSARFSGVCAPSRSCGSPSLIGALLSRFLCFHCLWLHFSYIQPSQIYMGKKNQRKLVNHKAIQKTRKNMAKDAEELSATDEEMHADAVTPPPPPTGSSNQKRAGDSSSEEEDEDDVSGERPAKGKQQIEWVWEIT